MKNLPTLLLILILCGIVVSSLIFVPRLIYQAYFLEPKGMLHELPYIQEGACTPNFKTPSIFDNFWDCSFNSKDAAESIEQHYSGYFGSQGWEVIEKTYDSISLSDYTEMRATNPTYNIMIAIHRPDTVDGLSSVRITAIRRTPIASNDIVLGTVFYFLHNGF